MKSKRPHPLSQYCLAWMVHAFTGSGAFIGVWSLFEIHRQQYTHALWLMGLTLLIDALDGTFARLAHVKSVLPQFDGALLDNIIDYLNYVIAPCFFLLAKPDLLPPDYALWVVLAVTCASAYQFCQQDAKTADHFFKGFPCYWNFILFYMLSFNTSMGTNALALLIFCALVFIPIKYVYPSRIDFLTHSAKIKVLMHGLSILYGISTTFLLLSYPKTNPFWLTLSFSYIIIYMIISIYRTFSPLKIKPMTTH